jgi:lysophospholipase L1-like esterase
MTSPSEANTAKVSSRLFERLTASLFLLLIVIISSIVIMELASRIILGNTASYFEETFSVGTTRHPYPYFMFAGIPNAPINPLLKKLGYLNVLGYRGKAPDTVKPENEFRIFILGGSTVFVGSARIGVPSIPEQLEILLHKNGYSDAKVFNFGVASSVSGQELARLLFTVSDLEPDLIIFYNGANDLNLPTGWDPRPGYPFNFPATQANPLLIDNLSDYPTLALAALGTNLGRHFLRPYLERELLNIGNLREASGFRTAGWEKTIASAYIKNVVKARHASSAAGASFIGYLQPMAAFKEPPINAESTYHEQEFPGRTMVRIRAMVREMAKQSGMGPFFADFGDIFDGINEQVFADDMHTFKKWYGLPAQKIFEDLERRGLLKHRETENAK